MPDLIVALLPPTAGQDWSWGETASRLEPDYEVRIVPEQGPDNSALDPGSQWVAHCALDLANTQPDTPVLLVAQGASARFVAALGFAERARRRHVAGYVLVDGDLPQPGTHDWPDAPVTYIGTREETVARLRGWDLLAGIDLAGDLRAVASASV